MLRKFLLPALSMIPGNAVCTVEVWNILKQYETTVRWQLYGEWRDVTYKSNPELKAQQALREREAKGILRRLSSQTVDSLSGTVAKMAHSNPCIFFTNAVSQIQAYENLADVVIQALRHSTNMGFDILVFITLDAMANPNKERVKEDGVYTSDWLQSNSASPSWYDIVTDAWLRLGDLCWLTVQTLQFRPHATPQIHRSSTLQQTDDRDYCPRETRP